MAMSAMADPTSNASEIARRLGMTTTTLYDYVNGDCHTRFGIDGANRRRVTTCSKRTPIACSAF